MNTVMNDVSMSNSQLSRDALEQKTLELLGENATSLEVHHIDIINDSKRGCFGFSYLGFMLYANGRNPNSYSKKNPCGLIFNDGENIFSLAFFRKELEPNGNYHLHVISPHGKNFIKIAIDTWRRLKTIYSGRIGGLYLRYLSHEQRNEAFILGAQEIEMHPWHPVAHSEDETYNHRIIDIANILANSHEDIIVKTLNTGDSKGFRSKARLAYKRFNNFLLRNNFSVKFHRYDKEQHESHAKNLVISHFESLSLAVGSTLQDYFNLIA